MWNFTYGGYFVLFGVALIAFFNGATALKIGHWTFWDHEFHGRDARVAGWILVLIGAGALVWLASLVRFAFGS
ncbi:MAG: hypothetical protein GKS06_07675 [Acidobacteria bacterium]|nr:hypothetical protein [Acidobacteriota bacterium]